MLKQIPKQESRKKRQKENWEEMKEMKERNKISEGYSNSLKNSWKKRCFFKKGNRAWEREGQNIKKPLYSTDQLKKDANEIYHKMEEKEK